MLLLSSEKRRRLAALLALCFFLGIIENLIPKPLPFFRLGLANLPLVLALPLLTSWEYFFLVFIKIFISAYMGGTLFSPLLLLALSGSLASGLGMWLLYRLSRGSFSLVAISVAGAFIHGILQILVAKEFLSVSSIDYFFLPILGISSLSGLLIGILTIRIDFDSWLLEIDQDLGVYNQGVQKRRKSYLIASLLLLMLGFVFFFSVKDWIWLNAITGALLIFRVITERKFKIMIYSLGSYFAVLLLFLLAPEGRLIAEIGPLKICESSLIEGLEKGAVLVGLIQISKIIFRWLLPAFSSLAGERGFSGEFLFVLGKLLNNPKENFKKLLGRCERG